MIQAGMTFIPQQLNPLPHLHIILTNPHSYHGELYILIVNLTSRGERSDQTVILNVGDHPWVRHPSVVFYGQAQPQKVSDIERRLQSGFWRSHTPMSGSILQRIQDGILRSRQTPREARDFYQGYLSL